VGEVHEVALGRLGINVRAWWRGRTRCNTRWSRRCGC